MTRVFFHCQQCAEKYLKGYLIQQGQPFRPVHDLIELLELACSATEPLSYSEPAQRPHAGTLSNSVIQARWRPRRYARAALQALKTVRVFVRSKLDWRCINMNEAAPELSRFRD